MRIKRTRESVSEQLEQTITAVDLFCGAGGLSLGLKRADIEIMWAADSWTAAVQSYRRNFSHPVLEVDLSNTTAASLAQFAGCSNRSIDVVVGGPPCQGFSIQRVGSDHDLRNNLVLEYGRLIGELRPRLFVMENVPGLIGKRGRSLMTNFEQQMSELGYAVETVLINAADFGVPQNRRRVFCFGWSTGCGPISLSAPTAGHRSPTTVWDAIGDLPSPPLDYKPHPEDSLHRRMRISPMNQKRIRLIPPGGGMEDLPVDLRVKCHRNGADRIGHRYVYGRLAPDKPAATITARFDSFTRGRFGHPFEDRNITLREGARLQTFPDDFQFLGTQEEIAALIGNAVPPLLSQQIGVAIRNALLGPLAIGFEPAAAEIPQLALFDSSKGA